MSHVTTTREPDALSGIISSRSDITDWNTPVRLIGVIGHAQEGKDTLIEAFAGAAKDLSVCRLAFADPIKDTVCARHGITREELERRKPEFRQELQYEGTEVWRAIDPLHWVKQLGVIYEEKLKENPNTVFAVADTRFPNEANWLVEQGALLVRVKRPSLVATDGLYAHSSEVFVDELPTHLTIVNDSLVDFRRRAKTFWNKYVEVAPDEV